MAGYLVLPGSIVPSSSKYAQLPILSKESAPFYATASMLTISRVEMSTEEVKPKTCMCLSMKYILEEVQAKRGKIGAGKTNWLSLLWSNTFLVLYVDSHQWCTLYCAIGLLKHHDLTLSMSDLCFISNCMTSIHPYDSPRCINFEKAHAHQ